MAFRKATPKHLFLLGQIAATPAALALLDTSEADAYDLLERHVTGDWGDLGDHDKLLNDAAVAHGNRVMSAYDFGSESVWVITEADRSVTTLMLREEY